MKHIERQNKQLKKNRTTEAEAALEQPTTIGCNVEESTQ